MSFYLVFDKAQIHNNREFLNTAEVKFYSFIADNNLVLPELDQLLSLNNPQEMRDDIRIVAKLILNKWESVTIQNIEAGHIFKFGDTGKILYRDATEQHLLHSS